MQVLIDGTVLPGVVSAEVSSNNHLAADRFQVTLASGGGGLAMLTSPAVRLDIQVGLGSSWVSLLQGEVDRVSFDPLRGQVEVDGRDLSALLVDGRVDETFANRTSSEIVETLASRHGLDVAATATTTLAGRYYQSEHDQSTMGQFSRALSEWDLLAYLAAREGFDLFMNGTILTFQPTGAASSIVLTPGDCEHLQLDHALTMTRSIEVTVRSWDQLGGAAVVQTARGGGTGRVWKHAVTRPNLPADEARRLAEKALADLLRHEWTVRASVPGELTMSPRQAVTLQGTGTDWDRVYSVSEIVRSVDVRRGFTQHIALQGIG